MMYCSQAITQSDTSPSGRAGGQPLTRQNSDPGTYGGDGAATGEPEGEPTASAEGAASWLLLWPRLRPQHLHRDALGASEPDIHLKRGDMNIQPV